MCCSSPTPPPAPDPVTTAAAQTKQNIDTANATAALNHANQITPYGSSTWAHDDLGPNGTSQWTNTVTLDPAQQKLLDSSNKISQNMADLGESQLGTVKNTLGQPLNYDNAPKQVNGVSYGGIQNDIDMSKVPELVGGADLAKSFQDAQRAAYGMQTQYLDPQYKQRQTDLETKLINQGVLQGTDAWNRETQNLGQQRTFDYNNAYNNSFDKGLSAQGQMYNQGLASNQNAYNQASNNAGFHNTAQSQGFGQGVTNANLQNQGRSQAINEANYLRQQPLNELNALRTGSQVTAPQFGSTPQGNVQGTDIASLYNNQYQGQLAGFNANQASKNSLTSGLFGLGSAFLMSDRRLKENIKRIGTHASGLPLYSYDYVWGEPSIGVMADEVEKVRPDAVYRGHPSGFAMVNYGALNA